MSSATLLVDAPHVRIKTVVPCAEDPDLVQLEGAFFGVDLDVLHGHMTLFAWKSIRLQTDGNIVARHPCGAFFLVSIDGRFSLSRVKDLETGLALINQLINQE